ncbi:MAG: Na+/H+ antiporter NhaA, partial [Candidatus Cryptobacteroides sp.]
MASKNGGSTAEGNISQYRNREIVHIFDNFMHNEATGGILLLVCAIIAVVMATVPGGQWFDKMWDLNASLNIGSFSLEMTLRNWVNDALMAVFFFVVGLEIKREILVGQLSSVRRSILPIMAALGGMIVPALIFSIFNHGNPDTAHGWGIPMATDIAFAVGVLSILGDRVPAGIKVFLTALAIVDDL